jgi:hypothetical protein
LASKVASETHPPTPDVPVVHPNAVYTADSFRKTFGLRISSLRREIRHKRLRVTRLCGKYFILGEWILEWIRCREKKAAEQD